MTVKLLMLLAFISVIVRVICIYAISVKTLGLITGMLSLFHIKDKENNQVKEILKNVEKEIKYISFLITIFCILQFYLTFSLSSS